MNLVKKRNKIYKFLWDSWDFLWNGDSALSWISFIIFIFIAIKFIFFPTIAFIMGTSLPIVIVESCSMYHDQNFDDWWKSYQNWYETREILKANFTKYPLSNGFTKGDIFFVTGIKKENIKIGDVIIFEETTQKRPIIHRVINLDPLQTKGDNNNNILGNEQLSFEKDIGENEIIGRATGFNIPYLGWLKLILYEPFRSEGERGMCKKNE